MSHLPSQWPDATTEAPIQTEPYWTNYRRLPISEGPRQFIPHRKRPTLKPDPYPPTVIPHWELRKPNRTRPTRLARYLTIFLCSGFLGYCGWLFVTRGVDSLPADHARVWTEVRAR